MNNNSYTDHSVFIAGNFQNLQAIIHVVNAKGREVVLSVNVEKTKIMVVFKEEPAPFTLQADGRIIERVSPFKYLDTLVNNK